MFSSIINKIKEVFRKMIGFKTIGDTLDVNAILSTKMVDAIELWDDMYKDNPYWVHEPTFDNPTRVVSLGLPSFIASEKARMATLEMKSEITSPNPLSKVNDRDTKDMVNNDHITNMESLVKTSPRVKFLNDTYQKKILNKLRPKLEYGIATGGLVIKPYPVLLPKEVNGVKARIDIDFIPAGNFVPLSFNVNGDITKAAFIQTKVDGDYVYRRLELHELIDGCMVKVQNKAFVSKNVSSLNMSEDNELGRPIALTDVPEWSDLEPEVVIDNVDRLLFAYFKMPEANTVDPSSPLGMSGYGRAVKLIRDADEQYSRLLWEFEATEAAIDIDRDALQPYKDANNVVHSIRPALQNRLFRKIDLGDDNTYEPFLPQIRDASIINGLNTILTRIEDTCALSRGTLSTVTIEATTAEELKILRQRSYSVNADIQKTLENTLKDVIYIMDIYCTLYNIVPEAEYEVSFEWDDSILVDTNEELGKRLSLVQNGVYSKQELRMWYFGETEEQAKQALKIIEDENKKSILENAKLQQEAGMILQSLQNSTRDQQQLNGRKDNAPNNATNNSVNNGNTGKM